MTYFLFVIGMIVFLGLFRALVVWLTEAINGPTAQVSTGPTVQRPAGTPTSRPE
jgi:hypothetical protein